ncbi:MAG TPA: FAD-dependent oxidoreductase [Rubrivivax sp.]|nr:FAD-dependent oxidoreductase [Rubrivivax sp.]
MKRLVLAGAGHAHAEVLRQWAHAPLPGVEVVVVSPQGFAPYSGMVPGWLAGAYRFEEIAIDFPALCHTAGAHWVEGEVDALDATRQRLSLAGGEELGYDLLSLNVGSTLTPPSGGPGSLLPMRPLSELRPAYEALLARWVADRSDKPISVTAVGGGAAGFESLLAVRARLQALRPDRVVHCGLVSRGATLLPDLSAAARRAALSALHRVGVNLQLGTAWRQTTATAQLPGDAGSELVLWATGAEAHAWQRDPSRRGSLAVSEHGFIRIDRHLRSLSHPEVFAVGDCAQWATALPKAGVFAVRMGPVLAHNVRAALGHGELRAYRPQSRYLVLLSTSDGRAIASRGALGAQGHWAWGWKDHIDRRFLKRYAAASQPAHPDGADAHLRESSDSAPRS